MGPEALAQVLRPLANMFTHKDHPEVMVGLDISDDAAVYRLDDTTALINTVDFFPPVVDDAYDYGAIAAANAMSDVYAMGGEVILALNVCCFPGEMPHEIITEILRGGADKVAEADGVLVGGHTVIDEEPKYGLSVVGRTSPDRVLTKAGARKGDTLVLTKALGVGLITTANKGGMCRPEHLAAATESMKKLNRRAAQLFQQAGVNSCTDVTGYALLGHACEIAERSGVRLRFVREHLPLLDGAEEYAEQGLFPGGANRNESCYRAHVSFAGDVDETGRMMLYTPETSGGLLASVSPDTADMLVGLFRQESLPCWVVGDVIDGSGVEVV